MLYQYEYEYKCLKGHETGGGVGRPETLDNIQDDQMNECLVCGSIFKNIDKYRAEFDDSGKYIKRVKI